MAFNIKTGSSGSVLSNNIVENIAYSTSKIESKLHMLKENAILKHPVEGDYYLVPKKDILYDSSNIIVVKAKFSNAIKLTAKDVSALSYNVVNDSAIVNMYERKITDEQYKIVVDNYLLYNNIKND